jgi:hypothetical protein
MTRFRAFVSRRLLLGASLLLLAATASADTVVVNPVPGNPVASGRRLLRLLADIDDASASRPYLLKVRPGVYDLRDQSLAMKPWVDVEGSGEGVTVVQSRVNSVGTIQGAAAAELRSLTVINEGPTDAAALRNRDITFSAFQVTCIAHGGSRLSIALSNHSRGGRFRDVTARAEGSPSATGVHSEGGLLSRVRAAAVAGDIAYAVFNAVSEGELLDVTAEATSDRFAGAIRNEGGAPLLRNVRARSHGADIGDGIVNGNASQATIVDAVIHATGGRFAGGVRNEFSSATLSGAVITVAAPTSAIGFSSSFAGRPTLEDVTIQVTGGGRGDGVVSHGTEVRVDRSVISADGFSLRNGGEPASSISVGGSRLGGPVSPAAGTVRCVASYDQAYTALGPACVPAP